MYNFVVRFCSPVQFKQNYFCSNYSASWQDMYIYMCVCVCVCACAYFLFCLMFVYDNFVTPFWQALALLAKIRLGWKSFANAKHFLLFQCCINKREKVHLHVRFSRPILQSNAIWAELFLLKLFGIMTGFFVFFAISNFANETQCKIAVSKSDA